MTLKPLCCALFICLPALAAVTPDRTRVVFNTEDKATSLKIENQSKQLPYLAYSWIENAKGEKSDQEMMVLPPIQHLDPGALSQVRIVKQAGSEQLPKDRESLFYFNLREIPPKAESKENHAIVQMALQTRIKLFWRPSAIRKKRGEITEQVMRATLQEPGLRIDNPGPYYITLAYFGRDMSGVFPGFTSEMIPPFGNVMLKSSKQAGRHFNLGYIDDYGALHILDVDCQNSCTMKISGEKQ